jgi:hypothetical protein
LKLLTTFKGIAKAEASSGSTILFWKDVWNGRIMEISYPHLCSFTKSENISLQSVLSLEELRDLFNLPLFEEAYQQYCELEILLQTLLTPSSVLSFLQVFLRQKLLESNWGKRSIMAHAGACHTAH